MKYLLTTIIGATTGVVMELCGYPYRTWQFWAVMACLVAMYCVGCWDK